MLEGLMKGLAVWLYGLLLEIVEFIADSLLEVFNMDLAYFETNVPVTSEIVNIIMAAGWAILIGNLTFQAIKSMMSGIGFEGEDPKILFCRTFVFSFLLVASRQICEVGLGIASRINTLLQMPNSVRLGLPPLDVFAIPGSWLLVIIMGVIVMVQIVKFFFEIAERYVVLAVLTILSPLAFGVGGSKNTEDIFKGWARIFGSSCLMMVFNTVFLKLLLSAMSNVPSGAGMLPWMLLVVAIARVARKIDDIVARVGLNTARTGDPISHGGIMYPIMVARTLGQIVSKTAGAGKAAGRTPPTGRQPSGGAAPHSPPPPPSPGSAAGGASNQPQQNGGGAGATNGASGSFTGTQLATQAGTPSAMSPTGSGVEKDTPPSRPPVGIGRKRSSAYSGGHGDEQPNNEYPAHGRNSRPPLSVDSATPDGINNSRVESASRQGNSTEPMEGGKSSAPPLSVDSRTPDIPRSTGRSGVNGLGGSSAGQENRATQGKRPHKPVNIDIYRDDDPAGGSRSGSAYRGNPSPSAREVSRSSGHSQSVSHTENNSNATRQSIQESSRVTTDSSKNAASASGRVSSAGAGRIGGLNQSGEASRAGGINQTGGVAVPGNPHRASSVSTGERISRVSPPASNDTPSQSGSVAAAQSGAKPIRENTPSAQSRSGIRPQEHHTPTMKAGSSSAASVSQTNNQGARPARYRRVDRTQNDIQNAGVNSVRPIPHTRPTLGKQPPERDSSLKGGKRP